MDKTKLIKIGICILVIAIAFGAGKYSNPSKIITKIETVEVIKLVEVKQENKNVVIKTKKTTQKDGTVIEESQTEDKSITKVDTQIDSKIEAKSETITIRDIGLNIGVVAIKDITNFNDKTEYAFTAKKRIFSNITLNGLITTDKKIGVGLGWDF